MLKESKKLIYLLLTVIISSFLLFSPAVAADQPPAEGGDLPPIQLVVPEDPQAKSYLGLSEGKQFTIPQIEAQVVVIEIFNMY
jgi:hypothetical protein